MAAKAGKSKTATKRTRAAKEATRVAPAEASEPVSIEAYKGFDRDLKCRGMQYAVGETLSVPESGVALCAPGGLHSCEMPLDVLTYYGPATSRYATVRASGRVERAKDGDSKIASAQITVKAELRLPELIRAGIAWILARAKGNTATGDYGHAAATGYYGHAAATGDSGHAAATGDSGHAAATGDSGHAAATGDYGHAAATGDSGHAAATGDSGHAAATGDSGCAFAGFDGRAKASASGAFAIAWFDHAANRARIAVGVPGVDGIEADVLYLVLDGKLVRA